MSHLPQVAGCADRHLRVWKEAAAPGGRLVTRVAPLETEAERAAELSAMLDLGLAAGGEMLRAAEKVRASMAPRDAAAAAQAQQQRPLATEASAGR